jgi:hypothetical protein
VVSGQKVATVVLLRGPGVREAPRASRSAPATTARELVDELEVRLFDGRLLALLLTPLLLPLRGRYCPTPSQLLGRLRSRLGLRPELSRSLTLTPLRPHGTRTAIRPFLLWPLLPAGAVLVAAGLWLDETTAGGYLLYLGGVSLLLGLALTGILLAERGRERRLGVPEHRRIFR